MLLQEVCGNIFAERIRHTTVILLPSCDVLVWIVRRSWQAAHIIKVTHFWGRPSMATEEFLVNDSHDGETIENVTKLLPQLDVKAPFAFVVKAVDPRDRSTLVVTSKEEKVLGAFHLE